MLVFQILLFNIMCISGFCSLPVMPEITAHYWQEAAMRCICVSLFHAVYQCQGIPCCVSVSVYFMLCICVSVFHLCQCIPCCVSVSVYSMLCLCVSVFHAVYLCQCIPCCVSVSVFHAVCQCIPCCVSVSAYSMCSNLSLTSVYSEALLFVIHFLVSISQTSGLCNEMHSITLTKLN